MERKKSSQTLAEVHRLWWRAVSLQKQSQKLLSGSHLQFEVQANMTLQEGQEVFANEACFICAYDCQPYIYTTNYLQQLSRIRCCISSPISPCRVSDRLHCTYFCCAFAASYPSNSSMLTVKYLRARASWKPPGCFIYWATCCSGAWKVNEHFPNKPFHYFNLFVFVFGCSPATACNSFPVPLPRLWRQHHINTQQ